jgi:hypothetical protein
VDPGAAKWRLAFSSPGQDDNGDPLGPFDERFRVRAALIYLKGAETVIQARQQGVQPVILRVRDSRDARTIDNAWKAEVVAGPGKGATYNITGLPEFTVPGWIDFQAQNAGPQSP